MYSSDESRVAVVTGANTGVGFKVCERLVRKYPSMTLCLACRNKDKMEQAATSLREISPEAKISIVMLDTSSVKSAFSAAGALKEKFSHIDYLFLNAGMMSVSGVNWSNFWKGLFSSKCFHMFSTGDGLLIHNDYVTDDNLQGVFATNVFGHYILLKELENSVMETHNVTQRPGQIIWTSSANALECNFSLDDIQHKKGKDPYSSSKYMIDSMTIGLNERLNEKNVYVHTVCPGLMSTNLTHAVLPTWIWTLIFPILFLLRLFVSSMTVTPANGAEALVWLIDQEPSSVGPNIKLHSCCGVSGNAYVGKEKLKMTAEFGEKILTQLDTLEDEFRKKKR